MGKTALKKIPKYISIDLSFTKLKLPIALHLKYCILILATLPILLHPSSLQAQPLPPTESKVKISGEALFGTAAYGGVTLTTN